MAQMMDRPFDREHDGHKSHGPILTAEEARQGAVSGRVRMILRISLALCVVAFVILIAIKF
jgi:hypothetical protein